MTDLYHDKTSPFSEEAERRILCQVLLRPHPLARARAIIEPDLRE